MKTRKRARSKILTKNANNLIEDGEEHKSEASIIDILPTFLLVEILSRMPIKSILKCKCVCKSWYDLISDDPYLVNQYLTESPFAIAGFLITNKVYKKVSGHDFYLLEFGEYYNDIQQRIKPEKLNISKSDNVIVVGSCNGLLCLRKDHVLYICNPILREYFVLPKSIIRGVGESLYAFGCSADNRHYKVMRVLERNSPAEKYNCQILTVGVNPRWRKLKDTTAPLALGQCNGNGVFHNGKLHWVLQRDENHGFYTLDENISPDNHFCIVSFNFGEEKLAVMAPPPCFTEENRAFPLTVLGGCLSVCVSILTFGIHIEIWGMKDYGVEQSWTRECILDSSIQFNYCMHHFIVIQKWRNGEILFRSSGAHCLSYDSKKRKSIELKGYEVTEDFEGVIYVPNFSSLRCIFKGGGYYIFRIVETFAENTSD